MGLVQNGGSDSAMAWRDLFETMEQLQAEMEALAQDRPLDRAEGNRYLARLLASGLARVNGRPGPAINYATPRIGGFNPDYLFGSAVIDPRATYRIRGKLNDVHRLALGTYTGQLGNFQPIGYLTKDQMHCGPDGGFEVRVSDAPAATDSPNWLAKSSKTTALMVRQLVLRATDRPAELLLERLDPPEATDPAPLCAEHQRNQMKAVVLFVAGAAGQFFRWTRTFSQLSNTIARVPQELEAQVKADPDTFYAIGYFNLDENERLDVHFTPPACDYWGLQTTNHWLEPIEHDCLVTHHNHATAEPNPDGSVTLSICPGEAPQQNALHTLGHRNGAIFFRVIGAQNNEVTLPVCNVRKC